MRHDFSLTPSFAPLFRELDAAMRGAPVPEAIRGLPGADVLETAGAIKVLLDLPGHQPGELDVKVEDGTLTVRGERKPVELQEGERWLRRERTSGTFSRSFRLPPTVDASRIEAKFEHGVLTLTLPHREDALPRRIDVKVQE